MKTYSTKAIQNLIDQYLNKGGNAIQTDEGCLGMGNWILMADGYKTAIVKEIALNEWSSGHTVRMYSKLPKKYEKQLELV